MMSNDILADKSYEFAKDIIFLTKDLQEKREFILSRQILRSGTAIGALVREAKYAESRADFIHKMTIALKEANEIDYWLNLLFDTDFIDFENFSKLSMLCNELIVILITTIKTTKSNTNKPKK